MASKNFLETIFQAFSKWNFFKPQDSKVHPTLEEGEQLPCDNSSTESESDQAVALWQDFIEEYDCLLMDIKGQKAEMYLLENRPLVHEVVTGAGLNSITEQLIQSYGLQVMNIVLDVICDPTVNRSKDTLESILNRMELLDYGKWEGQKLIVWIEDFPSFEAESDDGDLFGRLIITEVMRRRIEPQMVIPCHDMDREVMKIIKNMMQKDLHCIEEDDYYYETSMYQIALRIALASAYCNFIIIDANQLFIDEPVFRDLTEFATTLGHEVMFLRYAPNTNKTLTVNEFTDKVENWARANNKSLCIDITCDEEDESLEPSGPLQGAEILHKLTGTHFTQKSSTETSETDSFGNDEIQGSIESEVSEVESDSQEAVVEVVEDAFTRQADDSDFGKVDLV